GIWPGTRRELLDRGQRNHLAADLRKAFRAPANPDEAFGVDGDDVAGVVPALAAVRLRRHELAGVLGAQVPEHHIRSAHDQQAAFVDAFDFLEPPLDARQKAAHGAAPILHRAVHAEHRARLGRTVAFKDANPELLRPQLSSVVLQLLGAREYV